MKRTMILFAFLAGTSTLGAHATTIVRNANLSGRPVKTMKITTSTRTETPNSCTISVTGSISAGFGSISATCSATEGTCSLAQTAASTCLSNLLKSLRAQLK